MLPPRGASPTTCTKATGPMPRTPSVGFWRRALRSYGHEKKRSNKRGKVFPPPHHNTVSPQPLASTWSPEAPAATPRTFTPERVNLKRRSKTRVENDLFPTCPIDVPRHRAVLDSRGSGVHTPGRRSNCIERKTPRQVRREGRARFRCPHRLSPRCMRSRFDCEKTPGAEVDEFQQAGRHRVGRFREGFCQHPSHASRSVRATSSRGAAATGKPGPPVRQLVA